MSLINHTLTINRQAHKVMHFIRYSGDLFISIGKPTPWSDLDYRGATDANPPKPSLDLLSIPEPMSLVRIKELRPAVKSPCGNRVINGVNWQLIDPSDIQIVDGKFLPSPTHIYIAVLIREEDYLSESFRAIGLHSDVILKPGANPHHISFPLSFVDNIGVMHWAAFSTPIYRNVNKRHYIELMVEL